MLRADLSGKFALVTGASSGFGKRFAQVLAQSGAEVILAARRLDRLEALAGEIRASGGLAHCLSLDLHDTAASRAAIAALPGLDIVVNNAGIAGRSRAIDCPDAEWREVLAINLDAVWTVAQAAAQHMIAAGRPGSIINIASITGHRPGASSTPYSTSKAAVIQLTRSAAMEWARHGIRVNAISPGYFETDLNREFLASPFGQEMKKRIPQRRFGETGELDGALLLLASDASRYMTGSDIVVDGGHLVSQL